MFRALLFTGAVCGALLTSAPAAHAGNICVTIDVDGQVHRSSGPICVPYGPAVVCDSTGAGAPGQLYVTVTVCIPRPIG